MIRFFTYADVAHLQVPAGWRCVAWCVMADGGWFAAPWLAATLGAALRLRDRVVLAWARHLGSLGLVREGERVPWPGWLSFGWAPPLRNVRRWRWHDRTFSEDEFRRLGRFERGRLFSRLPEGM